MRKKERARARSGYQVQGRACCPVKSSHRTPRTQMRKLRLHEPRPQSRLMVELGSPSTPLVLVLYAHHLRAFQREKVHDAGMMGGESSHLAASSSNRSFTNCRGTCRESTLSAICSRIRRWLPSVVGKRYMRQMAPPNTEGV